MNLPACLIAAGPNTTNPCLYRAGIKGKPVWGIYPVYRTGPQHMFDTDVVTA